MNIMIDPQEKFVWLACEDGYHRLAGHTAVIDNFEFSIVPIPEALFVNITFSDLKSGHAFLKIPLLVFEAFEYDTEKKTLEMYREKARLVSEKIERIGKEQYRKIIKDRATFIQEKFGDMPDWEVLERKI